MQGSSTSEESKKEPRKKKTSYIFREKMEKFKKQLEEVWRTGSGSWKYAQMIF
jgi:hypothetical protein